MTDEPKLSLFSAKAKFMITAASIALAVLIGLLASYFLGPDNAIEQEMEQVVDEVIEHELHLPDGAIDIDLNLLKKK